MDASEIEESREQSSEGAGQKRWRSDSGMLQTKVTVPVPCRQVQAARSPQEAGRQSLLRGGVKEPRGWDTRRAL